VYAEDPTTAAFLPSPGTLGALRAPAGPWVRNDGGYYAGCRGPSATTAALQALRVGSGPRLAVRRMRRALDEYVVTGIARTSRSTRSSSRTPTSSSGRYHTGFIPRNEATLLTGGTAGDAADAFAVAAAVHAALTARKNERASAAVGPAPGGLSPWRMGAIARLR
jgi:acetyl-CoA carboxylase biotin carboxylase subunit